MGATQDEELRSLLRKNTANIIPLLYINKTGILLLESPSTSSQRTVQNNENKKIKNTLLQKEQELATKIKKQNNKRKLDEIKTLQQKQIIESGMVYHGNRVKKKAKGPNPLSCKKKKNYNDIEQPKHHDADKGSRKHKRRKSNKQKD